MSWILGIDTSSSELSIGLIHEGKPVVSCACYVRNSHAEHITRAVNFVLDSGAISAGDIAYAGIAVGPGSFTGLRIGISFLKGFFLTRNTPILPVSSLTCIAESYGNQREGLIIPVMDARQERVFCARFRRENGTLTRHTDDELMTVQSFSIFYKKNDTIIIDTLGYKRSTLFSTINDWGNVYQVTDTPLQRGLACARIAARSITTPEVWKKSPEILPEYMQPSYAEIKKKKKE